MSQLLQIATRFGEAMPILSGVDAPDYFDQGIPYISDEGGAKVAVEIGGTIDHYHQGLPYTATGRLVVATDKPVVRYGSGASPFEALEELAMGSGAVDHYSAGIPYTVDGAISVIGALADWIDTEEWDDGEDWQGP